MVVKRKARTRLQPGEKEKKFKFLSFADQIAKISVDYASSSLSLPNELSERHTFFFETVSKWIDLDYGDDFKDFLADISHEELATYSQILHHQEKISHAIQKHLRVKNSSALCAILEISIAFARDLRDDFKPHFWSFFDTVVFLIESRIQNIEVVEGCFRSLTVFFKLQWRNIVQNLRRTLSRLFPLFSFKQDFVRRFIAEAASFLLRKSASIPKIVKFIVERACLQDDEYITDGITQLLFNAIKGTKGFFHSQVSNMLNLFLDAIYSLIPDAKEFGVEIMERVMAECVHHGEQVNFKIISETILNRLSEDAKKSKNNVDNDLRLVRIWILEKNGHMFSGFESALRLLSDLLDETVASQNYYDLAANIICTYYANFACKDVILHFFEKTVKITTLENIPWLFSFFRHLVDLSIFDLWAMESAGKLGNELIGASTQSFPLFLDFYTDVIIQKNEISLFNNHGLNKFFDASGHKAFRKALTLALKDTDLSNELYSKCVIVAPYFLIGKESNEICKEFLVHLESLINKAHDNETDAFNAYLILYSLKLMSFKPMSHSIKEVISFLRIVGTDEIKLRIVDLLIFSTDRSLVSIDDFNVTLEYLEMLVGNPNGHIRHLALRILKFFSASLKDDTLINLLDAMIQVERQPLTFENHRERASALSRVRTALIGLHVSDIYKDRFNAISMRFTISQFFGNLTLYWPLVSDIAKTMGEVVSGDVLWMVFNEYIESSSKSIRSLSDDDTPYHTISSNFTDKVLGNATSRVDYWSFRLEVLKLLSQFMELAERKNRSLVPLLLDIYNNEFQSVTVTTKLWDDLTTRKGIESDTHLEESMDSKEIDEYEGTSLVKKLDRKLVTNTIRQILLIFSKFSNLKQVFKSNEVFNVVSELLRSDRSDVQKYAVDCLFNYKIRELDPYKKNFENLVADNLFSDELVHFSVDEEATVIADEHRAAVLPMLMLVLDGKMHSKTGRRGVSKRPAIFRFVAGCRSEELELFLKTVFWTINDFVDDGNVYKACDRLIEGYNPHKTVALQRISSILECLSDVFKKLPQCLSDPQRAYVYQVYILCHLLIQRGLSDTNVSSFSKKILKYQRTKAFNLCPLLLNAYQKYDFSKVELDALCNLVIEPYLLEGYKNEDSNTLIAIIRAFNGVCSMPRYFSLLNRPFSGSLGQKTPVTIMVDFLFSSESTRANQAEVVEALLKLFQDAIDEYIPFRCGPQAELQCTNRTLSLGIKIAVNHSERLLHYLHDTLPNEIRSSSKATTLSLSLLESLSGFVEDPSLGSKFSLTLLKFVEMGYLKNEQNLTSVLNSVAKFVESEENPVEIFGKLPNFLSDLRGRKARAALVNLEVALRNNINTPIPLKNHLKRLELLESWDRNRIDEPDYELRHQCIVELNERLETPKKKFSLEALIAYTHELAYNLINVDEISIRSAVSNTLRLIATFTKQSRQLKTDEKVVLLYDHLIVMIQRIIRCSNESVRHEGISILASCIDLFGNDEINNRDLLKYLKVLRDAEDKDKCFFENVSHLQMHRRQKAFHRLAIQLKTSEITIPLDVLERFIVPLVRPYLLLIESKLSTLSDEAIHLYAQIVKLQPWSRYFQTLGKYISQIKNKDEHNTKPAIRVLSAILDQFRFDVKNVELPRTEFQIIRQKKKREKLGSAYKKAAKQETVQEEHPEHLEQLPNLVNFQNGIEILTDNQKILATVLRVLLPKLRECIQPPSEFHAHKKAQNADNYHTDQEEILRAPLAVTTVKLLQKLPRWAMDLHLNGVILTMFKLLLSRSYLVRQAARKTMEQILRCLGPTLLPQIIRELRKKFTRGYQVHVMTFTVHAMISCLQDLLKPGDLNPCLNDIFEVAKEQFFGDVITDERQLQTVKANTPEAKSNRAYDTFIFVGRYITVDVLGDLLNPMKKVMDDSPNAQTQKKLAEMLRSLSVGIKKNIGIEVTDFLDFTSSFLTLHLSDMYKQSDALRASELKEERERECGYRPQNCLLLAAEPKRLGVIVKTSTKSKVAVFVEFALQLFSDILIEKKKAIEEKTVQEKINGFVPLVTDALKLKYEKITSVALRALHSLFRYDLPAINDQMAKIVDRLFIVLSEYANSMGTSQLNVAELNLILFKCFVTVVRKAPKDFLTAKRVKILLNHVEMDVLDSHRQTTAFVLAKAVISRHLIDDKIEEVIKYLSELCVTSSIDYIREQCRDVVHHYLKIHPNGRHVAEKWLKFFLEQIDYELVHGRLSALEMVHTIFELFNDEVTDKFGFSTFVKLASRFLSEDNSECCRYLKACIREIIASVSEKTRNDIYLSCMDWLSQPKDDLKSIGAASLIEFVKTPEVKLNQNQISDIICALKDEFFKSMTKDHDEEPIEVDEVEISDTEEDEDDHEKTVEFFLYLFVDLVRTYLELVKKALTKRSELQRVFIYGIIELLQYRHEAIQVAASILLEHLMAASESLWPMFKVHADFSKLCNSLIFQLRSKKLSESIGEQAIKNLATLSSNLTSEQYKELCQKLAGVVRLELKKEDTVLKRINVFKFIAAQLAIYTPDSINFSIIQEHLLGFLFREVLGKSKPNESLQNVSNELAAFLREKLGTTLYSKLLGEFQVEYGKKQTQRRQERREMLIQNPELAVKRKQKVNKKKSVAKKRKLDELRPHRIVKRKRREEIERTGGI